MPRNPFANDRPGLNGFVYDLAPVVPDDATDNINGGDTAVGLYVETGGAVVITTASGDVRTVQVGDFSTLIVGVRRVHATGTTATGVHGLMV